MGEVAVSRGDLGMKRLEGEADNKERDMEGEGSGVVKKGGESSGLVIVWEKFLKRRMVRVLLVEADDSTRQIIAALLRKCSYRVAAVSDGLKAWEILKGRPHNIDLILTEVDLPAISGYALLTLIMEHEICKNIPVIMMSSHDSVSTVYKCMLRGAADYLVKPIRKNELRNLWQHVWRRQTAQQKIEATYVNNTASNHSRGEDKQFIEKGNEVQRSCTKPDLEVESAPAKDLEENAQSNTKYLKKNDLVENEVCINLGRSGIMPNTHSVGLTIAICKNSESGVTLGRADSRYHKSKTDNLHKVCGNNEAIDLNAAFQNYPNFNDKNLPSSSGTVKNDPYPQLDLSLRRPQSHHVEYKFIEEGKMLVRSNASAFRRYSERQMQTSSTAKYQIECRPEASNLVTDYYSETSVPSMGTSFSPVTVQSKESDVSTSQLQQPALPISVPVGMRFNRLCQDYGSQPPKFCKQSSPPPVASPSLAAREEHSLSAYMFYHSPKPYATHSQNLGKDNDLIVRKPDLVHVYTATDQSVCSVFRDGTFVGVNSIGYVSNCGSSSNVDQLPAITEGKTEDLTTHGFSNPSILREAALTKFRMKRKERCYGKKVRYESRKKLAEQRPRIKGQFVRQEHPKIQHKEKDVN